MDKPDPYGEWVIWGNQPGKDKTSSPREEELLIAARAAWRTPSGNLLTEPWTQTSPHKYKKGSSSRWATWRHRALPPWTPQSKSRWTCPRRLLKKVSDPVIPSEARNLSLPWFLRGSGTACRAPTAGVAAASRRRGLRVCPGRRDSPNRIPMLPDSPGCTCKPVCTVRPCE